VARHVLVDAQSQPRPRAEGALIVADCEQDRGIGSALVDHLAHLARRQGIRALVGTVQHDNQPMQQLLASQGAVLDEGFEGRGVRFVVPLGIEARPVAIVANQVKQR